MPDNNLDGPAPLLGRQIADFVAILVGLGLIGAALYDWGGLIEYGQRTEIAHADAVWTIELLSGTLAVAAVILAQWPRWLAAAQAMSALAGIMLILGLFFFLRLGWRAWVTFALPGLLLVGLSLLLGPVPPPASGGAKPRQR
ncbi:MAG TPA: hypothetical protein VGO33_08925 [Gemmatimonadaceae bacterium]|jgi:hypothetical protein|nr:hypothetical protein [Gemmatimonadaceae bacterium]